MGICSKNTVPLQDGMEWFEPYAFYSLYMVYTTSLGKYMIDIKTVSIKHIITFCQRELSLFQGLLWFWYGRNKL